MRITIGIDNGQSGSIGIIKEATSRSVQFLKVPSVPYLHYGKKGTVNRRLDRHAFKTILRNACDWYTGFAGYDSIKVYIERPYTGTFLNTVLPAHRFFESTINVFEDFDLEGGNSLGYEVVDSRVWQDAILGKVPPTDRSKALKRASKLRANQLYPQLFDAIEQHDDADGLLIAHYFHFHS